MADTMSRGGSGQTPVSLLTAGRGLSFSRSGWRLVTAGQPGWGRNGPPFGMPLVPDPVFGNFDWAFSPYSEWPPVDVESRWSHFEVWFAAMHGAPVDVMLPGLARDFVWSLYEGEFMAHERFWLCGSWVSNAEVGQTIVARYVPRCIAWAFAELAAWRPNTGPLMLGSSVPRGASLPLMGCAHG